MSSLIKVSRNSRMYSRLGEVPDISVKSHYVQENVIKCGSHVEEYITDSMGGRECDNNLPME